MGVTETEFRGNQGLVHNWCAHHLKEQPEKVGWGRFKVHMGSLLTVPCLCSYLGDLSLKVTYKMFAAALIMKVEN